MTATVIVAIDRKKLSVTVTYAEYEEFKTLVTRSINTWDTAPQWIKNLNDLLMDNPVVIPE